MKIKLIILSLCFVLFTIQISKGQCDKLILPEDPARRLKAEESYALLGEHRNNDRFHQAAPYLHWLLTNVPKMHGSIYIYGTEVYEELAKAETEPRRKQVLVDSLMLVYDLRIQNCGEEAVVLNRKAFNAYQFNLNQPGTEMELLQLFDKTFELNGNNVMDILLVPYMQIVQVSKVRLKNLTDEEILKRYHTLMDVVDVKKTGADARMLEKLNGYAEKINDILFRILDSKSCDLIKKVFEPKLKANAADTAFVKSLFGLMFRNKCTKDSLWIDVVNAIAMSRDFDLTMGLGQMFLAEGNVPQAEKLYREALSSAPTQEKKADGLMHLANLELKKGNKEAARKHLLDAIAAYPSYRDAYKKLGDIYSAEFHNCAKGRHQAEDRLIFIAAYEMYEKAGDRKNMEEMIKNFPSKGELFELNWKPGEKKKVDCWIDEIVILRTRD